jgi:predicted DNA-binding transcriptional regulator
MGAQIFDAIGKVFSNILEGYEKEAFKISDNDFVTSMKNLLERRTLKYEVVAKELEIQLSNPISPDKVFKKVYKHLDKLLNNTIKDIKKNVSKHEKPFKIALIAGISGEHKQFVNCFKIFEEEIHNANF